MIKKRTKLKNESGKKSSFNPKNNEKLFNQYIMPQLHNVRSFTRQYTNNYCDIEDNYNFCLAQLYKYIHTYKPEEKFDTWLHIVIKRACFYQNKKRFEEDSHWTDIEMCSMEDLHKPENSLLVETNYGSLADNISDKMLSILMKISPLRLSPFMQYAQGYTIREITAMEYKMGHLEKKSEEVVRSRIYWAISELRYEIRNHGN